jgi:hypothetical protein
LRRRFSTCECKTTTSPATTSLRLGPNLTFSNLFEGTAGTVAATTQNFAIDTNGYAAAFSSQPVTVISGSGVTNTVYDLVGSDTPSALGSTLDTGSTTVNVGSGLTLVASGSLNVIIVPEPGALVLAGPQHRRRKEAQRMSLRSWSRWRYNVARQLTSGLMPVFKEQDHSRRLFVPSPAALPMRK